MARKRKGGLPTTIAGLRMPTIPQPTLPPRVDGQAIRNRMAAKARRKPGPAKGNSSAGFSPNHGHGRFGH